MFCHMATWSHGYIVSNMVTVHLQDLHGMIDAAKYADLVLLMVDGGFGFEMETFEFLNLLQVLTAAHLCFSLTQSFVCKGHIHHNTPISATETRLCQAVLTSITLEEP